MFDAKGVLDQLVRSGVAGGLAGGIAGSALVNALSSKKARKVAGSAIKVGGVALVGGLAYKAWQHYQQGRSDADQAAAPTDERAFIPAPDDADGATSLSLLLARAMISAAKADGQIDTAESQAILEHINGLALPADEKARLFEAYARPLDIEGLAGDVHSPQHAAEVYAASVLMLEPPSPSEQIYLDTLARELALDSALVAEIHAAIHESPHAAWPAPRHVPQACLEPRMTP